MARVQRLETHTVYARRGTATVCYGVKYKVVSWEGKGAVASSAEMTGEATRVLDVDRWKFAGG